MLAAIIFVKGGFRLALRMVLLLVLLSTEFVFRSLGYLAVNGRILISSALKGVIGAEESFMKFPKLEVFLVSNSFTFEGDV